MIDDQVEVTRPRNYKVQGVQFAFDANVMYLESRDAEGIREYNSVHNFSLPQTTRANAPGSCALRKPSTLARPTSGITYKLDTWNIMIDNNAEYVR
jgi:hypothetical protein